MNEGLVRLNALMLIDAARTAAARLELLGDAPVLRDQLGRAADAMEATLEGRVFTIADGTLVPARDEADEARWTPGEGGE